MFHPFWFSVFPLIKANVVYEIILYDWKSDIRKMNTEVNKNIACLVKYSHIFV